MRNEYPRPDFQGESFISLNGKWDFLFDDEKRGLKIDESWFLDFSKFENSLTIEVPFCFQSKAGGIQDTSFHDVVWYHRSFLKPEMNGDERLVLHFEGVDYYCRVYVNGLYASEHTGSNAGFKVDITELLKDGENHIVVYVLDPSTDTSIPRGKQDWEETSHGIWYTRTTGIYKSVWMEVVPDRRIDAIYLNTKLDKYEISAYTELTTDSGKIEFTLVDKDGNEEAHTFDVNKRIERYVFNCSDRFVNDRVWSFEKPYLFDLRIRLLDSHGNKIHEIKSYVGFREVTLEDGMVKINGKPVYQKLVLNQGYYPDGVLTATSIDVFEKDIDLMKEMGFNGCRVHQKTEDPYFLYLCDKKGFYVWQECASNYGYNKDSSKRLQDEWIEIVKNNYNHPSIITYTPLNESWGVEGIPYDKEIQAFAQSLYHTIHALDSSRPVVSNDGWEQCKTDLITVHNYSHGRKEETEKYEKFVKALSTRENILKHENINRFILNPGYEDEGQPMILTEFGGIAFDTDMGKGKNWGYTTCKDGDDYISELRRIYDAIRKSDCLVGICYTQLTDVEQEVNGLLTFDRKSKINPKLIKEINDSLSIHTKSEETI